MRLLLIGAPGSGKGTQAERIAAHFGITHISSGELLRRHVEQGTSIGRIAKEYMARGDLVPDQLVMDVLRKPVEAASRAGGYVLDGFPRTVEQAKAAYLVAKELNATVQVALYLKVSRDELIRRLLARAAGRQDDRLDVIEHRLDVFDRLSLPMLDYYGQREILITVNGDQPIDDVSATIIEQLERFRGRFSS